MPRTKQIGISLPEEMWEWILENHNKFGFKYPSSMVEYSIEYVMKNADKFKNSKLINNLIIHEKIGKIANIERSVRFSIANAPKEYKATAKGLREAKDEGFITKEEMEIQLKECKERYREVANLELAKDRKEKKSMHEIKRLSIKTIIRKYCKECIKQNVGCESCNKPQASVIRKIEMKRGD